MEVLNLEAIEGGTHLFCPHEKAPSGPFSCTWQALPMSPSSPTYGHCIFLTWTSKKTPSAFVYSPTLYKRPEPMPLSRCRTNTVSSIFLDSPSLSSLGQNKLTPCCMSSYAKSYQKNCQYPTLNLPLGFWTLSNALICSSYN